MGTRTPIASAIALVFVTLACPPVLAQPSSALSAPAIAEIEKFVRSEIQASRIPGVALGIVEHDRVIYRRGFGEALGRPVGDATRFQLGSTTKSFTAVAVMQLVQSGRLSLTAPVVTHLTWFRLADPRVQDITVQHLLHHTSGLPMQAGWRTIAAHPDETIEEGVRRLADVSLHHPPGSTFEYSNANYEILGAILEAVSGRTYAEYLREHIFSPLEMGDSVADGSTNGTLDGHRSFLGFPLASPTVFYRASAPAGMIVSTARDMTNYLISQVKEGRDGRDELLTAASMDTLHKPAAVHEVPRFIDAVESRYAMGWDVARLKSGEDVIWHTGMTFTFSSAMALLPQRQLGIVILLNRAMPQASVGLQDGLLAGVIAVLLARPLPSPGGPNAAVRPLAIGLLLYAGLTVVSVLRLTTRIMRPARSSRPRRRVATDFVVNLVVPLSVLAGAQKVASSWTLVRRAAPDVFLLAGGGSVVLLLVGAAKASAALMRRIRTRH